MKYKYILFDLDGTLCDPSTSITDSVKYALSKMGIDESDEDKLRSLVGPPIQHMLEDKYGMQGERNAKATEFYREHFEQEGIKQYKAYNGIQPMLEYLKSQNSTLIVATSKIGKYAESILQETNLREYFSYVAASNPVTPNTKTETIAEALTYIKDASKKGILMVGDTSHDIKGAHENDINSVGVLYGYGTRTELEEAGAENLVETVDQLAQYLMQ